MKNFTLESQVPLKCSCGSLNLNTLGDGKIKCECGREYLNQKDLIESNSENQQAINSELERLKKKAIESAKKDAINDIKDSLRGIKGVSFRGF